MVAGAKTYDFKDRCASLRRALNNRSGTTVIKANTSTKSLSTVNKNLLRLLKLAAIRADAKAEAVRELLEAGPEYDTIS